MKFVSKLEAICWSLVYVFLFPFGQSKFRVIHLRSTVSYTGNSVTNMRDPYRLLGGLDIKQEALSSLDTSLKSM